MKLILTGATGMVGEGVLMECINNNAVEEILCVSRKPVGITHPKIKEYLVPDFLALNINDENLKGYDGCLYCAGVSSIGMKEDEFTKLTYDITLHFAKAVLQQNPQSTFIYVSGRGTYDDAKGSLMWARVKGRTEIDLIGLGFKSVYNFRPAFMKATKGQKNILPAYKYLGWLYPVFSVIAPNTTCTLQQVAKAMIHAVAKGYEKPRIEVADIKILSGQ